MKEWTSQLVACNPLPVLVELLNDLAAVHDIHVCERRAEDEIGLGARPEAHTAVRVDPDGIALVLDAQTAGLLTAIGDLDATRDSDTQRTVIVPDDRLQEPEARTELPRFLLAAFKRSAHGPDRTAGAEELSNP